MSSSRLQTPSDALRWALGRISDRGEYWNRANEILATMSSPAAEVGTEDADAQAKALTYEEIAAAGLGLEYVHSVLRWTACGYVHTPERIASLHTSYRIVDRIINAKAAPQPPEAMAPAAPVAAVGEAVGAVVMWQSRFFDSSNPPGAWGKWEEVVQRNPYTNTMEAKVQELRNYIAAGYKYEVRALYAAPQPRSSPLKKDDVYTLLGHAEVIGGTDMPSYLRGLAARIARALGDEDAAFRCEAIQKAAVPDPSLQTKVSMSDSTIPKDLAGWVKADDATHAAVANEATSKHEARLTTPKEAGLPVVAYRQFDDFAGWYTYPNAFAPNGRHCENQELTPLSDAQAIIDALRAERDHALMAASCEATAGDEARAELAALKAAQPDPERVLALAQAFADANYYERRFGGQGYGEVLDDAREALRAYVTAKDVK